MFSLNLENLEIKIFLNDANAAEQLIRNSYCYSEPDENELRHVSRMEYENTHENYSLADRGTESVSLLKF